MILTPLGYVFENVYELLVRYDESELSRVHVSMRAPLGLPTYGPKPLVSPYGPHYSMHPELSRPIHGIVAQRFVTAVGVQTAGVAVLAAPPLVLFELNKAVIQTQPEEEQRGFWQMFSSALTGTWGGDYSGLI